MESKVKISKLEEGATIEIIRSLGKKEFKRKEFISEFEDSSILTLFRQGENIIETGYLITRDSLNLSNEKFLSSYGGRIVKKGKDDYDELNKRLIKYEEQNAN